jgi:hypothetical protein
MESFVLPGLEEFLEFIINSWERIEDDKKLKILNRFDQLIQKGDSLVAMDFLWKIVEKIHEIP